MPALPSGTVTFLFTDIEGSTRLWDSYPDAMRPALARHDALLNAIIAAHNGHVFKTIGDAFCAAFHAAPDALAAALAAQQALSAEPWPEPIVLKVRMALHTGVAESRDNDYFGQPLNRVARLLGTGHGGQVLISRVTQELVQDLLPPDCFLLNMGEHRLRDLSRPETIYQLGHPTLPREFARLKTLNHPDFPNNLPQQLTSFIGREHESEEVKTLLERSPLLTLTGGGGSGKTRLALQVAAELLDRFPDGVWLVELAPLSAPSLVMPTVAATLGVQEQSGQPLLPSLLDSVKGKSLLLVLDNCEHLLDACAQLTSSLLRTCPQVKVIATSREALRISGEQTLRVPSLALPEPGQAVTTERLAQYEAVRLFVERAVPHRTDFKVTPQNAPALVQICHRLDGIPLAIELAAARVRSLSMEDINQRLDNRFRLLTGGNRTALPRQQTLRALVDWSYDLLDTREKALLARLSVFVGGWTLAAAERVGAGESDEAAIEDWEVMDLLTSLVDKSLVIVEEQDDTSRYRMLETVRQYATEKLQASGESASVRDRHLEWCLDLAEEADPQLRGPDQQTWLRRLETEHGNLRAALAWCGEEQDEADSDSSFKPTAGLRLVGALWWFWMMHGHFTEGREHMRRRLNAVGAAARTEIRAGALNGAGALARNQGDYPAARALLEESLAIRRELGDRVGITHSLNNLGNLAYSQGDLDTAVTLHQEALALRRELNDRQGIAYSLGNLGLLTRLRHDLETARALYVECLAIFRELGDEWGIAVGLQNLGNLDLEQGDLDGAQERCEESLTMCRQLEDRTGIVVAQGSLGEVAVLRGDFDDALSRFRESLTLCVDLDDRQTMTTRLADIAGVYFRQGRTQQALRLWSGTAALREQFQEALGADRCQEIGILLEQVRSRLGEEVYASLWEESHAMSWQQAVEMALR